MGILKGRTAIITGAGQGIGAAIAFAFAREGANLVINDLGTGPDGVGGDKGPVHRVAEQINDLKGSAVADAGDIADVATGRRLVEAAVEKFGKLDIVVNVAGILRDRMIFNMTEADWDAVIRVHLKGHFSTIQPAAAYFRQQRNPSGNYRIINFTSASGLQGSPGQANYAAAKMGIVGLTYSLAQALARYGVTTNAVAPVAATRLTGAIPDDKKLGGAENGGFDALLPENIAPIVLYLASERSGWLTGRTVSAGGFDVGLYSNPEEIRQICSTGPWEFDQLSSMLERTFKPVADGLPPSVFATQLASASAS